MLLRDAKQEEREEVKMTNEIERKLSKSLKASIAIAIC